MTAFELAQGFSQLKEDAPHTCYSAPLVATGGRDVIASRIPWFAVRAVAGSEGLGVGHVRGWSPSLLGLQVNARPDVDEASIDEAIAALRSVGRGLVRFDARVLPWVDARERWLRWSAIRAAGSDFVLEDRLAIDDGSHRQAAATAQFDEIELRRLLAAGSRPNGSAELRREAVFLNDDSTAASASLLWLVPGIATPSGSDYRWTDGPTAFALAAHAIRSAAESEIAYWQEECWQAARYRRLADAWSASGASVPKERRTLGIIAEQFTLAASILLHASVVPAGQRRRAKLERAAGIIAGLAELHTEAPHDHA